jgi:hypothetical protein
VLSHPWRSEPGIVLLAPVTTVEQAATATAAGAGLIDAGDDGALVPAIRRAVDVRVCGEHEDADLVRDAGLAACSGATLICPGPGAAAAAVRRGIAAGRILVQAAPAGIEAAVRAGWPVLADLEGLAGPDGAAGLARIEAAAAVCVWLGASVLRTRHVAEVRRCADMTESILGRRPPAWAVRGLA